MMKVITAVIVTGMMLGVASSASAHDIFQDVMKEKYTLKSFSCKTCHPDSDDRKVRSMFAELLYQELKDKNFTEKYAVAEKEGEDAVKAFEKTTVKDFEKAMEAVGKKQMTFDALIKEGLFNGARLDEKKIAAMKEAGEGDAGDNETEDGK